MKLLLHSYSSIDVSSQNVRVPMQVNGPAHTKWLTDALQAANVHVPVLGGIPKVSLVWATAGS